MITALDQFHEDVHHAGLGLLRGDEVQLCPGGDQCAKSERRDGECAVITCREIVRSSESHPNCASNCRKSVLGLQ